MAENFSAALKRIKYVSSLRHTGDEYSFLDAPLRNFLNAIFPQADPNYATHQVPRRDSQVVGLGGLRRSFTRKRERNPTCENIILKKNSQLLMKAAGRIIE